MKKQKEVWDKKTRQYIMSELARKKEKMGLGLWEFQVRFEEKDEEGENRAALAEMSMDDRYNKATFFFYPLLGRRYKEGNVAQVDRAITHELVHCFTCPLYYASLDRFATKKELLDNLERCTESIAALLEKR